MDDHAARVKISHNSAGVSAVDPNGRVLFLVGSYDETSSDRIWHQSIYSQDWNQRPVLFQPDLQGTLGEPSAIFWSDLQDAFLIESESSDPKGRGITFKTSIVIPTASKLLDGYAMNFASDLPSFGVTALLGLSRLTFLDRWGVPTLLGPIKSGSEGDNWTGIYETGDQGWLYVDGDQYDHAVHVERIDGTWRIASLIRFIDEGALDRSRDQARMQMEGLSEIVRTDPCRTFSTAIKRMIVCRGQMQELRAGALTPIGSGKERLVRLLGDAPSLGMALFQSEDSRLYGYDGDHLNLALGTLPDRALVHDLPSSKRTFLSTNASLFELQREGQELRLMQLAIPSPHGPLLLLTHFFDISGSAVALLGEGAYTIDNLELKPLWVPDVPEQLDITSYLQPRYVPRLSGVLFASTVGVSGPPQFRLLTSCAGSN